MDEILNLIESVSEGFPSYFNIVRVVVACAVIGRMCCIEPSPGVPEVCYDTYLLPFYLYHNRP